MVLRRNHDDNIPMHRKPSIQMLFEWLMRNSFHSNRLFIIWIFLSRYVHSYWSKEWAFFWIYIIIIYNIITDFASEITNLLKLKILCAEQPFAFIFRYSICVNTGPSRVPSSGVGRRQTAVYNSNIEIWFGSIQRFFQIFISLKCY